MRYAFAVALAVAFASSATAANRPTSEQCKGGYKTQYSKMWTKDQFTKACADLKAGK